MSSGGPFDPTGYLMFDLSRGTLATDRPAGRAIVVPAEAVARIAAADQGSAVVARLGRAVGEVIGARVRDALAAGGDALAATPEAFLSETNGLLAVHGLGKLEMETIGDALLIRAGGAPVGAPADRAFAEGLASGILASFLGEDVRAVALAAPGGPCVLVGCAAAVEKAARWALEGGTPESIAARLHGESRRAEETPR